MPPVTTRLARTPEPGGTTRRLDTERGEEDELYYNLNIVFVLLNMLKVMKQKAN